MNSISRISAAFAAVLVAAGVLSLVSCGKSEYKVDSTPVALSSPARISFFTNSASSSGTLAAQGGDWTGLVVTDYRNSVVSLLEPSTLEVLASFPIEGRALSVATLDDTVFVGNDKKGSVEVYGWLGGRQYTLGFGQISIAQPQDIAIDPDDALVFVADGGDDDIKVFQADGTYVRSIAGSGAYLLLNPTAVAVDEANNRLIVSDYGAPVFDLDDFDPPPPRVLIFDYFGNPLDMIPGDGTSPASPSMGFGLPTDDYGFSRPQGLAYDNGYVFMVDCLRNVVLVFDISGSPAGVKTLGEFGSGDGQLFFPLDVVVNPATKDVFVTDNRNARVVVFAAGGQVP